MKEKIKVCDECGSKIIGDYCHTEYLEKKESLGRVDMFVKHSNTMCSEDCWVDHVKRTLKSIGRL